MVSAKPEKEAEAREQKHKTFVEKCEKQVGHFLIQPLGQQPERYLLNSVHQECEEKTTYASSWKGNRNAS